MKIATFWLIFGEFEGKKGVFWGVFGAKISEKVTFIVKYCGDNVIKNDEKVYQVYQLYHDTHSDWHTNYPTIFKYLSLPGKTFYRCPDPVGTEESPGNIEYPAS